MLKKFAIGAAGLATFVGGAALVVPQAEAAAETVPATVTVGEGYHLNVRSEANGDAAVRSMFLDQSVIELHCQAEGSSAEGPRGASTNWYGVRGGGFVAGAWLDQEPELAACGDAAAPMFGVTAIGFGGTVNLRERASADSPAVASVADGGRAEADCWVQGTSHTNDAGRTSDWWLRTAEGFMSEAFAELDATASSTLPICGEGAAMDPAPEQPAPEEPAPEEPAPEEPAPEEPAPEEPAPENPDAGEGEYPFYGQFHLPFANGTEVPVTQGPYGGFSHNNANNFHAVDLALPLGTPLLATGPGVIKVASDRGDGYGNTVYIDHGDNRCTQLAHMNSIGVSVGDQVKTGQYVGELGTTGQSTGPHLHWNIVACDGYLSLETPNTVEVGTNYVEGTSIVSQNPGA